MALKNKDYPLSNFDIQNVINDFKSRANIKKDNELGDNIFQDKGHLILFHKWPNQDCGHWYVIIRDYHGTAFFFDSLGNPPEFYNPNFYNILERNGISNLIINKKKYQTKKNSMCCGRYCLMVVALNKMKYTANEIKKIFEHFKKQYGSYDYALINIIS